MSQTLLRLENVGKLFYIYKAQKTLFRLASSLARRIPVYQTLWALKEISFEVKKGEKIALVGSNGAGKTTLFRVACGIYHATEGRVVRSAALKPLFRYGTGMNPHLAVIDNIYLLGAFYGLSVREVDARLEEILAFSELEKFLYLPVKNLSAGQVGRLCFSVFIQGRDNFFAFDETTALADLGFQKKMSEYFKRMMRSPEKTVLMAAHNLEELKTHCQRAVWLEAGRVRMDGPCEEVVAAYRASCGDFSGPASTLS